MSITLTKQKEAEFQFAIAHKMNVESQGRYGKGQQSQQRIGWRNLLATALFIVIITAACMQQQMTCLPS
jgi:hypothetical protein